MKSVARVLCLFACLVLGSGVLLAESPLPPVTMDVGPALSSGVVSFTLNAWDGGTLPVQVSVSAGDSPAAVATKIVSSVNLNYGWSAQASGGVLTFSHSNGMNWSSVNLVTGMSNTAGATMYLSSDSGMGGVITLAFAGNASGIGSGNQAGILTFQINGISSPYSVRLAAGQSGASILNAITSYLNAGLGDAGTCVTNPYGVTISLNTTHAAFTIQTNDSGLQGKIIVSEAAKGGAGGGGTDKGRNPPPM